MKVADIEGLVADTLRSPEPAWELRGVVRALLAQGYDRQALLEELMRFQSHLQATGQEKEEEIVMGVMDSLTGWCAPEWRL